MYDELEKTVDGDEEEKADGDADGEPEAAAA